VAIAQSPSLGESWAREDLRSHGVRAPASREVSRRHRINRCGCGAVARSRRKGAGFCPARPSPRSDEHQGARSPRRGLRSSIVALLLLTNRPVPEPTGPLRPIACLAVMALAASAPACAGAERPEASDRGTSRSVPSTSQTPPVRRRTEVLGRSSLRRPIHAVELGAPEAERTVLVVGCIHGTECAGRAVIRRLLARARPRRSRLWVIPQLNPDGHAMRTRVNARGVDLNRNFPAQWRPVGGHGHPEFAGHRPLSEPESRLAVRLIRRIRPHLSIWFHQPQAVVRAWGPSVPVARRYARLAGARFKALPWLSGTAPNWQNRRFPSTSSFVVELPGGSLHPRRARRHADAIKRLAP